MKWFITVICVDANALEMETQMEFILSFIHSFRIVRTFAILSEILEMVHWLIIMKKCVAHKLTRKYEHLNGPRTVFTTLQIVQTFQQMKRMNKICSWWSIEMKNAS